MYLNDNVFKVYLKFVHTQTIDWLENYMDKKIYFL